MNARLLAMVWIGPFLALLAGLGLFWVGGVPQGLEPLGMVVALSLAAGAPGAAVAALRGAVALPLGAAAALGLTLAAGLAAGVARLPPELVLAVALATAGLAALWVALCAGGGMGPQVLWRALLPGLLLAPLPALLLDGLAGALLGLGLGAAVAAVPAAAPAAMAPPTRLREIGPPLLLGLLAAAAVLAGPAASWAAGGSMAVPTLAMLVALPGLAVVATAREVPAAPLGTGLLLLQALAVALMLAIGTTPAALGLVPAEELLAFRFAVLGAGFLPVFVAQVAAALARGETGAAAICLGLFALLSAGLVLLPLDGALAGAGHLAAPVIATGVAALLAGRG